MEKIRIEIMPNQVFLNGDNTFDRDSAIKLSGKIAGVCYDEDGFNHIDKEPEEKTMRRVSRTINNGHHSVYDHAQISLNIMNIPKILAMVLNNEGQYSTSEKSARYTKVVKKEGSIITGLEEELYNKWLKIFRIKIKDIYGAQLSDSRIEKLAQENARYLVTVFMPTQMIYSTSLRQINYIASWMLKYIKSVETTVSTDFDKKLAGFMKEFVEALDNINVLDDRLMKNEKGRSLSLFGKDLSSKEEHFSDVYSTLYKGSFAQYAQAQRHRTLDYKLEMLDSKEYYVPPIITDDLFLISEWLKDMESVRELTPQGEMVEIWESGNYDNFILKCYERLCSGAQLETMQQTRETLLRYLKSLEESGSPLASDIKKYTYGARCTFPGYNCTERCNFNDGINLKRTI